jgi:hypothetical protein
VDTTSKKEVISKCGGVGAEERERERHTHTHNNFIFFIYHAFEITQVSTPLTS